MQKLSTSKKSMILASLMGSYLLAGSVGAANLLFTVPSDYTTSNGVIVTGSRVTTDVDTTSRVVMESLNRDPGSYAFTMDGKGMLLLRQYTYSATDLLPAKVIANDTNWSGTYPSAIITNGVNPHTVAGLNGYIYTGDYDYGMIGVTKYSQSGLQEDKTKAVNLKADINQYCGGNYASVAGVHGEGMKIKDGYLYIVASVNPNGGYDPYDDSYLMQYKINADGSLTYNSHVRSVRNPDSVQLQNYNDLLMHTGIGGMQYYGYGNQDTTGITMATISAGELSSAKNVVIPDSVKSLDLDMRDMVVHPNGTVYVLAYTLGGSGGGSTMSIFKTTVTNLYSDNPIDWERVISEAPGSTGYSAWFNKMYAEYYTKRLWGEFGDNVVVYTDGAKEPTHTWSSYDMGNYYTLNAVTLMPTDSVTGSTAVLRTSREEGLTSPSVSTTKIVNADATLKAANYTSRITGTSADTAYGDATSDYQNYKFSADKTILLRTGKWTDADKSNNILAAVYAHDGNDIAIDAKGHTLQLQVQNGIATPVGIYAGNGKNVTIDADKVNIITVQAANGNSLTNAIMNDAGKSQASAITINGDVNINMQNAYGGNGVAVQKTDRWGEASYASDVSNTIAINGNLKIKGADSDTWGIPLNYDNVYSRFNNAGILTQVKNSRVDVTGTADMDVYGNGITTNAEGSTVSIGGGEINVPKGMNYGYYTLAAYQGTINVNTGKDGTAVGNKTVKLGGDIFALATGTVNLALTNSDSYLRGIIDNGGTVNLTLQNGATWINTKNNSRYSADNEDVGNNGASRVTNFTGGASGKEGVIFQKPASGALTIDSYSGNAMVIYEHNTSSPASIYGGDVKISKVASGSGITVSTDNAGIDTTNAKIVTNVLDALAKKIYYLDYVNGSNNLSGKVQIAEGLTATSAAKATGAIAFSTKTGQGSLGSGKQEQETPPSGDNHENAKDFLLDHDTWAGSNYGDGVSLKMVRQAKWTKNNVGSDVKISAETSSWEGNNSGSHAIVTLDQSSWTGGNSGENTKIKLQDGSSWTGDNTGRNTDITIDTDSEWTGKNSADGVTLTMKKDSIWNATGDTKFTGFDGAGASAVVNMSDGFAASAISLAANDIVLADAATANVTIANYTGNSTLVYQHDAADTTNLIGGNFTVEKAAAGSQINLLTDNTGLDMTNKYAINATLDALAKKLYYKEATSGAKNLTGFVKIGEGLTASAVTKFTGGILYDSTTGQGSLDTSSIDYGADFPTAQKDTATKFTTAITGDYVTDKVYRDAGVLSNPDHTYHFTLAATTVDTGKNNSIATAEDTIIQMHGNDLTVKANTSANDAIAVTGGTLSVKDGKQLTFTGQNAIHAMGGKVDIDGKILYLNGKITAEGAGSSVTVKNVNTLSGDIVTDENATVDISFAEGRTWSKNNAGHTTLSMNKGTWSGKNTGKLNATFTNASTWKGTNEGADSTITLDASTWSAANNADNAQIILGNGSKWTAANAGTNANITLDASTWTGNNTGAGSVIGLKNGAAWMGTNSMAGSVSISGASTWTGLSTGDNFALTLDGGTWKNTGVSSISSLTGKTGVIDMTGSSGEISIGNYSGDTTVIYAHNATDPATVSGGDIKIAKADSGSKITLLTNNEGIDMTEEDSINGALNALAEKLWYTAYISGERNLAGTVKIAEGLTSTSVIKQTGTIAFSDTTGQGSLDTSSVNPGPKYPDEQERTAFTTQITGVHDTDKEYQKGGVLSHTVDNNIYNFTKDATTVTTSDSSIITAKDTKLDLHSHDLTVTSTGGDAIATTGGKLTVTAGKSLSLKGTHSVKATNSEVSIDAETVQLSGDVLATGSGASVTAKKVKTLTGDVTAESDGTVDLTFANQGSWTGNATGDTLSISLTDGSIWTGASSATGLSLALNQSMWKNTGTSSVSHLAGTAGFIDMTDASSGEISIGNYSGDTTVIYAHDANDSTSILGGDVKIAKAESGSKITLQTDVSGVDTTDEDSLYDTLDALAKKLYYTAYISSEKNLTGFVKIAEGLTSTSAAMQTGNISYDSATGQGKLDKTSVTPGPKYPDKQDRSSFTTAITGVHDTDKEYRKAGVLSNTVDNNIYNFTKEATTITTTDAVVTTAKDTKLDLHGNSLTLISTGGDGLTPTGGTLTVTDGKIVTVTPKKYGNAINAQNAKVSIDAETLNLGDGYVYSVGSDASVTLKNVNEWNQSLYVGEGGKADITFKEGATWKGSLGATSNKTGTESVKISMTKGVWTGGNSLDGAEITLDATEMKGSNGGKNAVMTFKNGSTWSGYNNSASAITLDASTWTQYNSNKATGTTINLTNGSRWENANTAYSDNRAENATINVIGSSWSGNNSGKNSAIHLKEGSAWKGNIVAAGEGTQVIADKSTWTGNVASTVDLKFTDGSTWIGTTDYVSYSWKPNTYTLDLTLDGSIWKTTGAKASELRNFAGISGVIDMTEGTGNVSIANYSGDTTVIYAHDETDSTNILGGTFTIGSAAEGSKITLLTDRTGVDLSDEDSINDTLDALAKKLYYTAYVNGERNLVGTVKIAEGLTATSLTKQTASIVFDDTNGQGGLDEASVTPGPDYPEAQTKESFTTSITGDYMADTEYRKAGVLDGLNETHTYDFTKDATTITTEEASIATSVDTIIDVHNHDLAVKSDADDAVNVSAGKLTIQNGRQLSFEGENAVKATDAAVSVSGESITLKGDVKAEGTGTVDINGTNVALEGNLNAEGTGTIQVQNLKTFSGNAVTGNSSEATLTFAEGGKWEGDASGNLNLSMNKGTWEGNSDGVLTAELKNGTNWTGDSNGAASEISVDASTWSGKNVGQQSKVTLINHAKWEGANTGDTTTVSADNSTWTGDNSGKESTVTLANNAKWSGANSGEDAEISVNNSTWTGDNEADAKITVSNSGTWTGASTAEGTEVTLDSATWENPGDSTVALLTSDKGSLSQKNEKSGKVTVKKLSGNLTVQYDHTASGDGTEKTFDVSGGDVDVQSATEGSSVTLSTDRSGISSASDRTNMENLFRVLAKKLTYSGVTEAPNNLTGRVQIAEGLTTPMAYGEMTFGADGHGAYKDGSLKRTDPEIVYGDSETAMMRGAKSAMAAVALIWRAEANDLEKRMGELRLSSGESGTWAKYYGGEYSYDSQKTDVAVKYNAAQVGYDRNVGKDWKVGFAISHNTGDANINTNDAKLRNGTGDLKATSFGIYATKTRDDGAYLDLIAKVSHLSNEYTVYNDMGHKLDGDYSATGLSFSAEYGKRFVRENGLVLTPSAELTVGRIGGKSYDAKSDFLDAQGLNKYMHVDQEAFTSAVARLAFSVGKDSKKSAFYTKLALAYEFGGDFKTTFSAENEPTSGTKLDLSGTWLEWQIGGSYKMSEKAYLYGTFEKIFGGKTSGSDWRLDAGVRFSF